MTQLNPAVAVVGVGEDEEGDGVTVGEDVVVGVVVSVCDVVVVGDEEGVGISG